MKRGEIFFAALDPTHGAKVQKTRPVIIVSNDAANRAAVLVTLVKMRQVDDALRLHLAP